MIILKEIIDFLNSIAPYNLQEDYDNVGLLIGNENVAIKKILVTLDITLDILKEAKEKGCELVIAHHPLIFKPLKSISLNSHIEKCVYYSIKNDLNIFCLHTNFDNIFNGINNELGKLLNLTNIKILDPKLNFINEKIGSGIFGEVENDIITHDFLTLVKQKLNLKFLKYSGSIDRPINKVAICSGSGSFLIKKAIEKGIDIFLTGDLKYHDFFYCHEGLILADIGHYESEIIFNSLILKFLSEGFKNLVCYKTDQVSNPVKFH